MSDKKSMMAVAIAKSICKEYSTSSYSRVVYLENGQEFQIQLFNPHKFTVGAEIFVNDEKLSNILVLKPGERIWLERYLDINKKFKFSTYEVEANDADAQEAIKDNGTIEVRFYKETKEKWTNPVINLTRNTWWNTTTYPPTYPPIIDVFYNTSSRASTENYYDNSLITSNYCTNCATSTSDYYTALTNKYATSKSIPDKIVRETGRIEAGSISNQEFDSVNIDFEYLPFITEKIKLFPISKKPYTLNDLHKIYCTECGRKLKTNYKFCPYCGSKID